MPSQFTLSFRNSNASTMDGPTVRSYFRKLLINRIIASHILSLFISGSNSRHKNPYAAENAHNTLRCMLQSVLLRLLLHRNGRKSPFDKKTTTCINFNLTANLPPAADLPIAPFGGPNRGPWLLTIQSMRRGAKVLFIGTRKINRTLFHLRGKSL